MNYQQQLTPWVIHQLLPNLKQLPVSRFRKRNEAEGHLKILQRSQPSARFEIAFDTGKELV
jgi:hypothetical protein